MHLEIIDGISNDKVRRACYAYLYDKYRREKINESDIRQSIDGRAGAERIQHRDSNVNRGA